MATNIVNHSGRADKVGIEYARSRIETILRAFPDAYIVVEYVHDLGEVIRAGLCFRGTHTGTFMGLPRPNIPTWRAVSEPDISECIPPTGKRVRWRGIEESVFVEGKIVITRGDVNVSELVELLKLKRGEMPSPGNRGWIE